MRARVYVVVALTALLVTGCAENSKSQYDEVDLIVYQSCINFFLNGVGGNFRQAELWTNAAKEYCEAYLPVKQ